jgi:inositol transport system ATP-binding protein
MIREDNEYVLEMKNISKAFPGVQALDKVNLKVRKGTVHVLVGENGAGKSTLMKILSGEHQIDEGEIFFKGMKLGHQNIQTMLKLGISMIHQELSPVLDLTIAENIFLGREPTYQVKTFVNFKELYEQTQELLTKLGLKFNPRSKMRDLSVAGMQLVEITKAISRGASLIIMDEPTSAITDTEVAMLFHQIRELKVKGVAIIYITHKLDEIFQIADDVTVIRDGKWIDSNHASYYDKNKLITQMVGRTISNIFPKETAEIGDTVLEVENITIKGVFKDISFKVKKGEILGLAGLVGAGRSEVARAIFGLDPLDSGEIFMAGKPIKVRTPIDAIDKGIAMLSEDRKEVGLILCRSVRENISLGNLKMFAPGLFINAKQEAEAADKMIEMLQIKVPSMNTQVNFLSGGNQQKVVLSKWLLGKLKILILDEPTRGIDVGSKSEIHKLMSDLAKQGLAVIMISSELPEILGMSDRILVMQEGRLRGEFTREEASQEKIMTLATGGSLSC